MLSVNNVTFAFGGVKALSDVSFSIPSGSISGLIDPNGAVKTSLFNVVSGIYAPTSGAISFNGTQISRLKLHQINRLGVARTFQNIMVFPDLSLVENVMIGRQDRTRAGVWSSIFRTPKERRERAQSHARELEPLSYVGLERKANELAKNLPYGDQRQLNIAWALATDPQILLLDELAAGLNLQERLSLKSLLLRLNGMGYMIVLIEHDIKLVMDLCAHIVVLEYGHKIADSSLQVVQNDEKVIAAYLGAGANNVEN